MHNRTRFWNADRIERFDPVGYGLLAKEASITLLGRGPSLLRSTLLTSHRASLLFTRVGMHSSGVTVLNPDCVTFVLAAACTENCLLNGQPMSRTRLYMPSDAVYILGHRRALFGVALPRRQFIDTIAALRNQRAEDVRLDEQAVDLPPATTMRLRAQLLAVVRSRSENAGPGRGATIERQVSGLMADAYLQARPGSRRNAGRRRATRIVRKAEERFAAAGGRPVSLADLCHAASVSKSTLYHAFHQVCGDSPLAYFRKRQLTQVRAQLFASPPRRGMVKHVALGAGLTELGRFAREYRQLFGELPSVTLNRISD